MRIMKNSIGKLEKEHYDTYAEHKTLRDTIKSSRLPRCAITRQAIKPILRKNSSLGVVVDIGCGIGPSAQYLNGYYTKYIGIDFSEEMIKIGKQFNEKINNVEYIVSDIKSKDLPTNIADTIIMDGALHHMDDLNSVMQSLKRIAKPNAYFMAREPHRGNPFFQVVRKIRMKIDKSYSSNQVFFSELELITLLKENNFSEIGVQYQDYFKTPFAQIVFKPQWIFLPLSRLSIIMDKILDVLLFGFLKRASWNIVIFGKFNK